MQQTQFLELKQGTYHIIKEIGRGASSLVYLVSQLTQISNNDPKILPTNSTQRLEEFPQRENIKVIEGMQTGSLVLNQAERENRQTSSAFQESQQFDLNANFNTGRKDQNLGNEFFALKTVRISGESSNSQSEKEKCFRKQLHILKSLKHPGVIGLVDYDVKEDGGVKQLHLVLQWGRGGSFLRLIELIHQRSHFYNQRHIIFRYYIAQMVEILSYLQSKGMSHRDIKAENFVLDDHYRLKLIDFETVQVFDEKRANCIQISEQIPTERRRGQAYIGSMHHISPEMILRPRIIRIDKSYYSRTDIWSLGVVIYYMFSRCFPFQGKNSAIILEMIRSHQPDLKLIEDKLAQGLLKRMLTKVPEERIDIEEIKRDPFFRGIDFERIFVINSPILKIVQGLSQVYFFRGKAVVRIEEIAHQRAVGLFKRSTPRERQQAELKQSQDLDLSICKNVSGNTLVGSEQMISSQEILGQRDYKMFLSIAKSESLTIPKHVELDSNSKLTVVQLSCLIDGGQLVGNKREEEPKRIEVRFGREQDLQKFIDAYKAMLASL